MKQFLYALTSSNIKRFSKKIFTYSFACASDVITHVIGIWSVFFENFARLWRFFVTMRVGRLTSDVVLFSVAFKTLDISQGSVATHFKCGGIFSDSIITNFLLLLTVK